MKWPAIPRAELTHLAAFALAVTAVAAVRPTVSYRALELGAGAGQIGLIGGAFAGLSLVAAIPIGSLIDRFGERPFFLIGAALVAVAALGDASVGFVFALIVTQALLGLGHLFAALATQTRSARGDPLGRDRRFARMAVAASLGQLGGPLLAGAILDRPGLVAGLLPTKTVFVVAAVLSVMAATLASGGTAAPSPRKARPPGPILVMIKEDGMREALVTSIAVLTATDIVIAYLPVLGEEIGLSPGFVGLLLAIKGGAAILSRLVVGAMVQWLGRRTTLAANVVAAGVAMAVMAVVDLAPALALLTAILGFGLGLGQPITAAWVSSRAPEGRVSAALALRLTGNRLGQLVLPATLGTLAGVAGTPLVFAAAAAGLLGSALWVRGANIDE